MEHEFKEVGKPQAGLLCVYCSMSQTYACSFDIKQCPAPEGFYFDKRDIERAIVPVQSGYRCTCKQKYHTPRCLRNNQVEVTETTPLDFNEYQKQAMSTAVYGKTDSPTGRGNLVYPAMGIAGEAGEYCDKVKKMWRNKGVMDASQLTSEERSDMIKELGDVLWYIAASASELSTDLETVAAENIRKLLDRRARGVIKSQGDNR
jgi:NTP pyrophosphatase (non-canonical NTP hydrolase)